MMRKLILLLILLIPTLSYGVTVSDEFSGDLSAWTNSYTDFTSFELFSGGVRSSSTITNAVQTYNVSISQDQYAQVRIASWNVGGGLFDAAVLLRASASPTGTFYYVAAVHSTDSTRIYRCEASSCTEEVTDATQTWGIDDVLRAEITTDTIDVYRNGVLIPGASYTDGTPLTGNLIGIASYSVEINNAVLDDFIGGSISATNAVNRQIIVVE